MTFWVYNLGLGVPLAERSFRQQVKAIPLPEIAKTHRLYKTDEESPGKLNDKLTSPLANQSSEVRNRLKGYQSHSENAREKQLFAKHIMTSEVLCLQKQLTIKKAESYLKQYQYRHYPVVDEKERILGILSDRDMLSAQSETLELSQVMSSHVLVASADTSIKSICEIMFRQHIGALPIIDDDARIIGLVTRSDILGAVVNHGHIEFWN